MSILAPLYAQVNAGEDKEICYGETVWLKATVEESFATQIFLSDDTVAGPFPIGFEFEFYGGTYTEFFVSDNGWISFSAPFPNNDSWNGGESPRELPSTKDVVPKNCIMGAWQDWSPAFSGDVGYEVTGNAPNRMLTVSYCQVSSYNCEFKTGTFQIVLRESVNFIDINLNSKPICPDSLVWYDNKAVLAVHNEDGTEAVVAPGRNATQWTATEETWRFKPAGDSYDILYLSTYIPVLSGTLSPISWYYDGNYVGTSDSIRVSPSSTTTYEASVFLCGDLEFSDDVEVVVHPLPIADAGVDQTIIDATSTQLDGSASQCLNGGCSFLWEPAAKIADDPTLEMPNTIPLSFTTAYYLTLEDQYGCRSDSDMVVINVINGPLGLLLTADQNSICRGTEVTITARGSGGEYPYTYEWNSVPPPAVSYPQDSFLIVQPDVTTVYSCKITDADGLTIPEETVTISVENPIPEITGQNIVCENETNILYTTPLHGNNSYYWTTSDNGVIEGSNIDTVTRVTWTASGVGSLIITETLPPPLGCVTVDTLEIQILDRPNPLVTGPETVCENQQGVEYFTVGAQEREYIWIADGGVINMPDPDTSHIVIDWAASGFGQVSVTEQYANYGSCKSSRTLDVTILPGPDPQLTGPQVVCEQDANVLYTSNAPSGVTNMWGTVENGTITGNIGQNQVLVTWDTAGEGYLLLSQSIDSSGCSAVSAPFNVTVHPKPLMNVTPDMLDICQHEEISLNATGADTLLWYPETDLSSTNEHTVTFNANTDIIYYVIGTNAYGCKDTAQTVINVTPVPVLDLGGDRYIRENDPITLFAGGGNDYYEWQDGSTSPEFIAYTGGEYYVYVEKNGCFSTDTILITATMGAIPIPTAFTPNQDGLNDEFRLSGQLEKVERFSMRIFARNGQLVYSSTDIYEGWDGNDRNGNALPSGSYIYSIELFEQGNPFEQGTIVRKGTITLLR